MIGIKGRKLYFLTMVVEHLEAAHLCHRRAMGYSHEPLKSRQWYRDNRKLHMQKARNFYNQLLERN